MAKTRSQSLRQSIKKEECEDKSRLMKLIRNTNNASKNKNNISKNKTVKTSYVLANVVKVKTEHTESREQILTSPMTTITQKQIKEPISYIVNGEESADATSKKFDMSDPTACQYYEEYVEDPEHRIPLPKTRLAKKSRQLTQEKINNLFRYIVHDKMGVSQAAHKANITKKSAYTYYEKYKADPDHKIPAMANLAGSIAKHCTQEQVNRLISYIVADKMSIPAASKKADMSSHTGNLYYKKYINDPTHKIPLVKPRSNFQRKEYTNEQIKSMIHYVTKENMTVAAAGRKVGMSTDCASRYYSQYLMGPNHEIPDRREWESRRGKPMTNEKVKAMIGYIVDDGMTLLKASAKLNISTKSAHRYYRKYLDDPQRRIPTPEDDPTCDPRRRSTISQVRGFFTHLIVDKVGVSEAARKVNLSGTTGARLYRDYFRTDERRTKKKMPNLSYSVEKMKKMVEYIHNDKMTVTAASRKAEISYRTARKYYNQYLKDPQHQIPVIHTQTVYITQEQITQLIHHIVNDKMKLRPAARKVKMSETSAFKYYNTYRNDPERKIPAPVPNGYKKKTGIFNRYLQIIADIYKDNPSIEPTCKYLRSDSGSPDIGIKSQSFE